MAKTFPFTIYSSTIDALSGRLKGYNITVKVEEEHSIREVYYTLREYLRKKGVVPLTIYPSEIINGECTLFLVLDPEDKDDVEVKRIIGKVENELEFVKSVEEAPRFGDIIYSFRLFPIVHMGGRWILLGPASIRAFICDMRDEIGDKVAAVLISLLGRKIGEETYNYYAKLKPLKKITEALEFLKMILYISSWGLLEEYEVERDVILIRVAELWECESVIEKKGCGDKPSLFLGALTGFFSSLFGKEVRAELISKQVVEGKVSCIISISRP